MLATRRVAFRKHEGGQGLAEYALILALIAMVALVALTMLGGELLNTLNFIGTSIESV
jgi:pilus assembly protein Flp/PilA